MKHRRKRTRPRKEWQYPNTVTLLASLFLLYLLADTPIVHGVVQHIGGYGYLGSFITGIFFVSTFTVAPASVVLFHLAEQYEVLYIALTAGAGAVVGDVLLFRFLRDGVFEEYEPLMQKLKRRHMFELFKTPFFAWLTPVVGALIIASPFPDEVGIGLMGFSRVKQWQFALLTYVLNTLGILLIVFLAQAT